MVTDPHQKVSHNMNVIKTGAKVTGAITGAILRTIFSILCICTFFVTSAQAQLEKTDLNFGFIKLTDMAPLAIAVEKGFFKDEGLNVTLKVQANWKLILDRVISGELDGAHMLAGQPLAASAGYDSQGELITPFSMDLNGNGITVANKVWKVIKPHIPKDADGKPQHPISASVLKHAIKKFKAEGQDFRMGMVYPTSTHNYELRYWLAAGGIHPGIYTDASVNGHTSGDVKLYVTPPPLMPTMLGAGVNYGYCVGEPWNQQAVYDLIGVPVITDNEIWKNNPEKVFGLRKDFAEKHPNTTQAIVKALIRAAIWLDAENNANRMEAVKILAEKKYVGANAEVIANSMTGTFEYERGDKRKAPDFNIFFRNYATYPFYSDAVWYLTQMRRWGQIQSSKPDSWYHNIAKKVYRPDIYLKAAQALVSEGKAKKADFPFGTDGFKKPTTEFIDKVMFDGKKPNDYLKKFSIGLK